MTNETLRDRCQRRGAARTRTNGWHNGRMPTWLRVVLLVFVAVWSFYCGHKLEDRLHGRLVRTAGRSAPRAVAVAVGYYLLQLVAYAVIGLVAAILYPYAPVWVVIVVLLAGLVLLTPLVWCLGPQGSSGGSSTAYSDLRKHRATASVARGLAYAGIPMYFLTFSAGCMSTAIYVLILGN